MPVAPGPCVQTACLPHLGRRRKAVRCLPDLAWPALRGTGTPSGLVLRAPPQRSSRTSDVEAQAASRDPANWESWPRPVRQAVLEALLQPVGPGAARPRTPPAPLFVNRVNCKSNTCVFLTWLVGWVPPGAVQCAVLLTAALPRHRLTLGSHGPVGPAPPTSLTALSQARGACAEPAFHPQPPAEPSPHLPCPAAPENRMVKGWGVRPWAWRGAGATQAQKGSWKGLWF